MLAINSRTTDDYKILNVSYTKDQHAKLPAKQSLHWKDSSMSDDCFTQAR